MFVGPLTSTPRRRRRPSCLHIAARGGRTGVPLCDGAHPRHVVRKATVCCLTSGSDTNGVGDDDTEGSSSLPNNDDSAQEGKSSDESNKPDIGDADANKWQRLLDNVGDRIVRKMKTEMSLGSKKDEKQDHTTTDGAPAREERKLADDVQLEADGSRTGENGSVEGESDDSWKQELEKKLLELVDGDGEVTWETTEIDGEVDEDSEQLAEMLNDTDDIYLVVEEQAEDSDAAEQSEEGEGAATEGKAGADDGSKLEDEIIKKLLAAENEKDEGDAKGNGASDESNSDKAPSNDAEAKTDLSSRIKVVKDFEELKGAIRDIAKQKARILRKKNGADKASSASASKSGSASGDAAATPPKEGRNIFEEAKREKEREQAGEEKVNTLYEAIKRFNVGETKELKRLVSQNAQKAMKRCSQMIMGGLPEDSYEISVQTNRNGLEQLLLTCFFTGYFIRRAEINLLKEQSQTAMDDRPPPSGLPPAGAATVKDISGKLSWWNPAKNEKDEVDAKHYVLRLEAEVELLREQYEAYNVNGGNDTSHRLIELSTLNSGDAKAPKLRDVTPKALVAIQMVISTMLGISSTQVQQSFSTERDYLSQLIQWSIMIAYHLKDLEYRQDLRQLLDNA